jgi:hypothetical protein
MALARSDDSRNPDEGTRDRTFAEVPAGLTDPQCSANGIGKGVGEKKTKA